MTIPISDNEAARVAALQRYEILDTPAEQAFDDITRIAAMICEAPLSMITFVGEDREWFKSRFGIGEDAPNECSFCAYAITNPNTTVVEDLSSNKLFADHPMVASGPKMRFYAGAPLETSDGYRIGTLCVLDMKCRELSPDQSTALESLARQVMTHLELRVQRTSLERSVVQLKQEVAERRQIEELLNYQVNIFENVSDAVMSAGLDFIIRTWNKGAEMLYGYTAEEVTGRFIGDFIDTQYVTPAGEDAIESFRRTGYWAGRANQTVKNGRTLKVMTALSNVRDIDGNVVGVVAVNRDITAQSAVEDEVAERERQFRRLAESLPDYIYIINLREMKILYSNKESFLGYTQPEWRTLELIESVHTEERPAVLSYFQNFVELLADGEPEIIYRLQNKVGEWDWLHQRATPFSVDSNGEVIEAMVSLEIITEQRRLEQQIQGLLTRRGRQVELIGRIAQEIATSPELVDLYRQLVVAVREQFDYYHVQLLRYDAASDALSLVYGYGNIGRQMLLLNHSIPLGVGLIGQAAATQRSLLNTDLRLEPNWHPEPLLPETKGELAVPIIFRNEIIGVLDVQSNVPGQLSDEDRLVLEGLCNQIAIAVESTRLRQEMEEQLREMGYLQRLMSREGWRAFQSMQHQASRGYMYDRMSLRPLGISEDPPVNGKALANGLPITVDDTELADEQGYHIHSTPIAVRGEKIGQIGIQDDPDNPLDADEQELLDSIADQVAEALENARLLEQTQKRAVELETVSRVSAATSRFLESKQLLESVVDLAQQSFDLYHAHIYLLDASTGMLLLAAGAGEVGREMVEAGWRIPLDQEGSIVAKAARQREGVVVPDVSNEADFLLNQYLPLTASELAVPMIAGNELLGVLDVQSEDVGAFGPDDIRIQSSLAAQIAVALQNATRYEQQLDTARKLREVDQLKSEFLASMSHELRTPLNSIIGFADVLLEGLDGELNPRMEEDVTLIRNSGRHLRNLIGDILDMSKIEAGKMELNYEMLNIRDIANEVMKNAEKFAVTYEKSHLTLGATVADDIDLVEVDRTRITQILYNLISNAIKFTEQGRVDLLMEQIDDELFVAVEDTGIGIDPENMSIVFEQFRQIDGSMTRTAGGTGLGLPITKHLVELHGGTITATSTLDKGTRFEFRIPTRRIAMARVVDTAKLGN